MKSPFDTIAPAKRLLHSWNERLAGTKPRGGVSTALLILSSAALGGIAVALWNRKTLAAFHELEHQEPPAPAPTSGEIEDLFEEDV